MQKKNSRLREEPAGLCSMKRWNGNQRRCVRNLRVVAARAKARMPVARSSQEDGSGTALGVGVRTKLSIAKGVMSTGSLGSKTST